MPVAPPPMPSRWPTLLALLLFGVYQVVCFEETLRDTRKLDKLLPDNLTWPAGWRMFTLLDKVNARLEFQGWDGEAWVRLPMEQWFPTRWDSGYRWERSARDRDALQAWLAEACARVPIERGRVVELRWEREPGVELQSEHGVKEHERATWSCDQARRKPHGASW